jgi:hypothetical protein
MFELIAVIAVTAWVVLAVLVENSNSGQTQLTRKPTPLNKATALNKK